MAMTRILSCLLLATILLLPAQVRATVDELEQRIATGPTVVDLLEYAYQHNPAIAAARQSWKAKVEGYRLETALPDPMLEGSYEGDANQISDPMGWMIGVSQTFPFPGTLARKGEVATAEARLAQLEFRKTARDVAVQVQQSVAELGYIRAARRIVTKNRELLDRLVAVSVSAGAQDRGTLLDVTKAQSQTAQLQYDAILMAELETTETARLNSYLSRPAEAAIGPMPPAVSAPVVHELAGLRQIARESLEELSMAATEVDKAEAGIRVARFETLPEIKLGAFISSSRDDDGSMPEGFTDKDGVGVEASLSLPLWFGKNQARLAAAEAEAGRARAARAAKENESDAELSTAFFRLKNAERLVTLYDRELLPQAAKAIATAETWFKQGQGGFSDLVETQTVFYNFELALARARADYEKYLARLEQLCGRRLDAIAAGSQPVTTPTATPTKEAP